MEPLYPTTLSKQTLPLGVSMGKKFVINHFAKNTAFCLTLQEYYSSEHVKAESSPFISKHAVNLFQLSSYMYLHDAAQCHATVRKGKLT